MPRVSPDEAKAEVRSRVDRLQSALAALGETESLEARGLQAALKEAERAAKERPLAIQVEECQAFIKRSQNRLARLEGTSQGTAGIGRCDGSSQPSFENRWLARRKDSHPPGKNQDPQVGSET